MTLFAGDALVGNPRTPLPYGRVATLENLESEMDRLGIARCVVRWRHAQESSVLRGNEEMFSALAGKSHLVPCAYLTPDGLAPSFDPGATLEKWLHAGARAFWMNPVFDGFDSQPWCSAPLYAALEKSGRPLLLECAHVPPRDLDVILSAHPNLIVIYLGVPRLGRHRTVYPLLRRHASLRVCLSQTWSAPGLIEDLVHNFGAERFIFGFDYPAAEGGCSLMGLAYARLDPADGARIAAGNLETLLARP